MRATFIPILRPTTEETLKKALEDAEAASFELLTERRKMCLDYYHNEVLSEDGGKDSYLKDYSSADTKDGKQYKKHLLLEHVNLTEQVIDLKSRVYKEQPVRSIGGVEAERYTAVLERSGWSAMSKRLEHYTNLLHDVALGVFYNKGLKRFQYQIITEYVPVFSPDDPIQIEPIAIIYPTAKRTAKGEVIYAYYDAGTYAEMLNSGDTLKSEPNTNGIFNFLFAHRKYPVINHFSTPAVSLVQANQAIDAAMTGLNQLMHYNGFKQLVIKGGVKKENSEGIEVKFGLGAAQVINLLPSQVDGQVHGDASVLDMQSNFSEHVNAIKAKMEFVANEYNIQFQWKIDGDAASGVAFEMQNVRDYEDRQNQHDVLMDFIERPLHAIVSAIGQRVGESVEAGELSVKFDEPKSELKTQDKIAWQKFMLETGQWDEADLIVENNPELTREDAIRRLEERDAERLKRRERITPKQLQSTPADAGNNNASNGDTKQIEE